MVDATRLTNNDIDAQSAERFLISMSQLRKALLIVDAQVDFCEGGSLAVEGGAQVVRNIAHLLEDHNYDLIVTTQDWHQPDGPEHFAVPGTDPDYNDTWPAHCVAGTEGAEFHPNLKPALDKIKHKSVYKGQHTAAFSGFEGHTQQDGTGLSLRGVLHQYDISQVDVVGLAFDYCVKSTALDAAANGYETWVIGELTAAVNPDNIEAVEAELEAAGVGFI
jgi:nicotinamidase/pyrazinamidase